MGVLQVDDTDLPQHALPDHRGHLVRQRVAGKSVGYADDEALLIGEPLDFLAFGDGEEQRLFTHHVETGLQTGFRDLIVREVRRGDGYDLDAVLALGLSGDQRLVVEIKAFLIHAELDAEVLAARRIDVEGAADQFVGGVVPKGAGPVLVADLAGPPASDHSPSKRAIDQFFSVQHCS